MSSADRIPDIQGCDFSQSTKDESPGGNTKTWVFLAISTSLGFLLKLSLKACQEVHREVHMSRRLILASGSEIRRTLLRNAGVEIDVVPARVDEAALRDAMIEDGAPPRDIADALAEMKATKVGAKEPDALVLGCDQILSFEKSILSKPQTKQDALRQLRDMRGKSHQLLSAAVIVEEARPVWRHVGVVRLMMRDASDAYLEEYVDRNWDRIRHSVGAYKLEEEGVRLFTQIQGDYFTVLGLPLLELLGYLGLRGVLKT